MFRSAIFASLLPSRCSHESPLQSTIGNLDFLPNQKSVPQSLLRFLPHSSWHLPATTQKPPSLVYEFYSLTCTLTKSSQASGRLGQNFTNALLATNKHTITTITHTVIEAVFPSGVHIAELDYSDDGQSLISALRGHQFLIITMAVTAPPDTESKIVKAAVKAGVSYIMPNVHGIDRF